MSAIACCAICARKTRKGAFAKRTIIVAEELTLSQLTLVSHENLAGIALQSGGVTSHAAILARSFEIPTVVGVEHLMESVGEGDALVLDGNSGVIYVNPSAEVEKEYQGLTRRYDAFKRELMATSMSRPRPATAIASRCWPISRCSPISIWRCATAPRASDCCARNFRS